MLRDMIYNEDLVVMYIYVFLIQNRFFYSLCYRDGGAGSI